MFVNDEAKSVVNIFIIIVIFNYFNNLPAMERDEKFIRALYLGVLALMEDRLSAFLSKTNNELGTELESLKMIFEMKKELFYKSTGIDIP